MAETTITCGDRYEGYEEDYYYSITDCEFKEIGASLYMGGAISIYDAPSLTLSDCFFIFCYAEDSTGGAIYFKGDVLNQYRVNY
jgi:hypothetical protein